MSEKQTQCKMLLNHFENGRSITDNEALFLYSIRRLSARVHNLRSSGYPIKGDMVTVQNQYGKPCRVKRYYMGDANG